MEHFNPEVYLSEDDLAFRVSELAKAITNDFEGQEVTVICVLKGAFMFCSDLIKKIELPVKLEFIQLSSYGDGTKSSGNVNIEMDISAPVKNQNIIVVEDIVDTGQTMTALYEMLAARGARTVKLASLLYKPSRNTHPVTIDYLGFEIEDKFVVGYGLDYAGRYRELPYVGILNAGN